MFALVTGAPFGVEVDQGSPPIIIPLATPGGGNGLPANVSFKLFQSIEDSLKSCLEIGLLW